MGMIYTLLGGAVTIGGGVMVKLLSDEFGAWAPKLSEILVARAVRSLPKRQRVRYREEWRSHLADTPGNLTKVVIGLDFLRASRSLRAAQSKEMKALRSWMVSGLGARIRHIQTYQNRDPRWAPTGREIRSAVKSMISSHDDLEELLRVMRDRSSARNRYRRKLGDELWRTLYSEHLVAEAWKRAADIERKLRG